MSAKFTRRELLVGVSAIAGTAAISTGPALAEGAVHKVDIHKFKFMPDRLEVNVGDKVVFTNKDLVPHTATAEDKSWDSKHMAFNDEWSLEVAKAGEMKYFCLYHRNMRATLVAT